MLMLANQSALDVWRERVELSAQPKMAQLQALAGRVESYSSWWRDVKAKNEGGEFDRAGSAAIISVQGVLEHHYSVMSYIFDSDCYTGIAAKVKAAAEDSSIDHIVLQVHSPGGVHFGCPECAEAVWNARQVKRVTAVVDYEAASAAYFIASQATQIVGIQSGWVGSIGTQIMMYSMSKMYEKMGIDAKLIRAESSPKKNLGHPVEPLSDEAIAERQKWVNNCADQFISAVARGRGRNVQDVRQNFGQGAMVFMDEALRLGMIDSIGRIGDAVGYQKQAKMPQKPRNQRSDSSLDAIAIESSYTP